MPTDKEQELLDRLASVETGISRDANNPWKRYVDYRPLEPIIRDIVREEVSKSLDGLSARISRLERMVWSHSSAKDDWTQK